MRDLRAVGGAGGAVLATGRVLASVAALAAVAAGGDPRCQPAWRSCSGPCWPAPDPVAVSALGRRAGPADGCRRSVHPESMFNDATSLVLFQVAVSFAVGTRGVRAAGARGMRPVRRSRRRRRAARRGAWPAGWR